MALAVSFFHMRQQSQQCQIAALRFKIDSIFNKKKILNVQGFGLGALFPILKKDSVSFCQHLNLKGQTLSGENAEDIIFQPIVAATTPSQSTVFDSSQTRALGATKCVFRVVRIVFRSLVIGFKFIPLGILFPACYALRYVTPKFEELWFTAFLKAVETSGPTFIKFMQWASTRPDLFSLRLCMVGKQLHSNARRHRWDATERALIEAFGTEWESKLEMERTPIGSGCVAQVYKGHLVGSGQKVAVKVIHPHMQQLILTDLDLLRLGAALLECLPRIKWLSLSESVEEFAGLMTRQIDLEREARSLRRLQQNFGTDAQVRIPKPIYPLVTPTVLVETFEEGQLLSEILAKDDRHLKSRIAKVGLTAFLHMTFLHNFVHGDLHPGNMLVSSQPNGELSLTLLDPGITVELGPQDRQNFLDLFSAVAQGQGIRAGTLMLERARESQCSNPEDFCEGVASIVKEARSHGLRLERIKVGKLLQEILALCCKHKVKLESNFASVIIAIGVLEGVGRDLDPNIDILQAALPIILKANLNTKMNTMK
mmetsp:Transcript_23336/g.30480  ORF Transcript_23336/g.30480 Transcript_23336/m.30480 type:complete len:540 (-) Transcript_23336:105-1724(-)